MTNGAATDEIKLTPELIQGLLKLPPRDREHVADVMLDSLEESVEESDDEKAAFRAEIARRIDDYLAGRSKSYTMEEFFARIDERRQQRLQK